MGLWTIMLLAAATMLLLAVVMAWILGWANRRFHVDVDPRVAAVIEALPGANCGGCGYVGCSEYAEAVAAGKATPDLCPVGGEAVAEEVAEILGLKLTQSWPSRPAVHCGATYEDRLLRSAYRGEASCSAANLVGGIQGCTYGCLGFGDCERACAFDAIHVIDGLARVNYEKCVGCGACEKACPRHIISMVPFKKERMLIVACSNQDSGKEVKAVCKVGCIGCTGCQRRAGDLFKMQDNIPVIDYDAYDPDVMEAAELAVAKCPMKRLTMVGKPTSDDLDATAGQEVPEVVTATFETTIDKTEWQG